MRTPDDGEGSRAEAAQHPGLHPLGEGSSGQDGQGGGRHHRRERADPDRARPRGQRRDRRWSASSCRPARPGRTPRPRRGGRPARPSRPRRRARRRPSARSTPRSRGTAARRRSRWPGPGGPGSRAHRGSRRWSGAARWRHRARPSRGPLDSDPRGSGPPAGSCHRARPGTPRRTRPRHHPPVQSPRSGTRPVPDATLPPCAAPHALALAARGAAGGVREHRRRRRRVVRRGMQGRRRRTGDVGGRRPALGHRLPARSGRVRSPSRSTTGTRGRTTTSTCPPLPARRPPTSSRARRGRSSRSTWPPAPTSTSATSTRTWWARSRWTAANPP